MAERNLQRMSQDEFFAWQAGQDKNYELVDGVPVLPLKMMTGATRRHDTVTVNAIVSLGNQLRGGPCRPVTADIALRVPAGNVRRPDLMVDCGPPDSRAMDAGEPRLAFEVLSPSTMSIDRFRKVEEYKTVGTLAYIVLADTRAPSVTVYEREPHGSWLPLQLDGLDAVIELPVLGARLALAELYEGLSFPEAASEPA